MTGQNEELKLKSGGQKDSDRINQSQFQNEINLREEEILKIQEINNEMQEKLLALEQNFSEMKEFYELELERKTLSYERKIAKLKDVHTEAIKPSMEKHIEKRLNKDQALRQELERGINQAELEYQHLKQFYQQLFDEKSYEQEHTMSFIATIKKSI